MQSRISIAAAFAVVLGVAACGGGGGGTGTAGTLGSTPSTAAPTATPTSVATATPTPGAPTPTPSPSPTASPTPVATSAAQSAPVQGTVGGSAAFEDPTNDYTLYELSADGNDSSVCTSTGGCTGVWPPLVAPAGAVATGSFAPFTRSDGVSQWAYNGHPLYTYAGDGGPAESNGDGIQSFGGTWSVSRPAGTVTPTPSPTPDSQPTPCYGQYC